MFFEIANIFLSGFLALSFGATAADTSSVLSGYTQIEGDGVVIEAPVKQESVFLDVFLTAGSAIAVDVESGAVLFKKNIDEVRPIASITKLMTAMLFLESGKSQDEMIEIKWLDRGGGKAHLDSGEKVRAGDILRAALVASDNTAAAAIARYV